MAKLKSTEIILIIYVYVKLDNNPTLGSDVSRIMSFECKVYVID